jgi:GTPase SAR1 family protein
VTVGVEFNSKTVEINEKTSVMLQVWDTVNLSRCRPVRRPSRQSSDHSTKALLLHSSFTPSISLSVINSEWKALMHLKVGSGKLKITLTKRRFCF